MRRDRFSDLTFFTLLFEGSLHALELFRVLYNSVVRRTTNL